MAEWEGRVLELGIFREVTWPPQRLSAILKSYASGGATITALFLTQAPVSESSGEGSLLAELNTLS